MVQNTYLVSNPPNPKTATAAENLECMRHYFGREYLIYPGDKLHLVLRIKLSSPGFVFLWGVSILAGRVILCRMLCGTQERRQRTSPLTPLQEREHDLGAAPSRPGSRRSSTDHPVVLDTCSSSLPSPSPSPSPLSLSLVPCPRACLVLSCLFPNILHGCHVFSREKKPQAWR